VRSKLMFVIGLAVGYVFGTRAGRERYEQLKAGAEKLWTNPSVQTQVSRAEDYLRERAPEVVQRVESTARKVSDQVKARRATESDSSSGV
jgi:SLT domain-containing protein